MAVRCAPFSAKPVSFSWSNFASFHDDCVWQSAQTAPREPRCTSSGVWQLAQAMGVSFQRLAAWQDAQDSCACRPCSAKRVLPWSYFTVDQREVSWQAAQSVPSLPWCGSAFLWQSTHPVGASRNFFPATWQPAQATLPWAPSMRKSVCA